MELRCSGMMWKTGIYAQTGALPAIAAALALSSTPASSQAVQPIVDARPQATEQAAVAPEAMKPALNVDEDVLMLGGGTLALLALGGGAFAMTRRRRHDGEMIVDQSMTIEPEPAPLDAAIHDEQPAIVAPSAFNWGEPRQADPMVERPNGKMANGETWVERAYRGPTPDNPSLSLRKRLKRAAFFDAREERVAAGRAEPVDTDAGLPENAAGQTRERELELA